MALSQRDWALSQRDLPQGRTWRSEGLGAQSEGLANKGGLGAQTCHSVWDLAHLWVDSSGPWEKAGEAVRAVGGGGGSLDGALSVEIRLCGASLPSLLLSFAAACKAGHRTHEATKGTRDALLPSLWFAATAPAPPSALSTRALRHLLREYCLLLQGVPGASREPHQKHKNVPILSCAYF